VSIIYITSKYILGIGFYLARLLVVCLRLLFYVHFRVNVFGI